MARKHGLRDPQVLRADHGMNILVCKNYTSAMTTLNGIAIALDEGDIQSSYTAMEELSVASAEDNTCKI